MKLFSKTARRWLKTVTDTAQKASYWWLERPLTQKLVLAVFCAVSLSLILAYVRRALDNAISESFADVIMFSISTLTLLAFSFFITSTLRSKQKFEEVSVRDHLTGVYNRRLLHETIRQVSAQAKRHGENVYFLFIDLDRLKSINDTFGHAAGDAALITVTRVIESHLREENRLFRIGGDEFFTTITLSEDAPEADSLALANRITNSVNDIVFFHGKSKIQLGVSIGVHLYNSNNDIKDEITRADEKMYAIKHPGDNPQ